MTTFLTKLFTGKKQQPIKSAGYREEPIGGFTIQAKNKQLEQMIQEISASPMPGSQKDQLVTALKKMRVAVDSKGILNLDSLPEKTIQEIEQHLLSVSKATAKPKPTKPLTPPSTRPAAKAPLPAPAPRPVVKKKPTMDQIRHQIYCNPNISIAARPYAVQVAEIKDRYTDANGTFNAKNLTQEEAFLLRRSERRLSEILNKQSIKTK